MPLKHSRFLHDHPVLEFLRKERCILLFHSQEDLLSASQDQADLYKLQLMAEVFHTDHSDMFHLLHILFAFRSSLAV